MPAAPPARHVQADSTHRNHPATPHLGDADLAETELGLQTLRRRGAERFSKIGMAPRRRLSDRRHPEVGRKHPIKTQGVISERGDATPRDVFADWPNVLRRRGYVEFGSGHDGGVI